MRFEGRAVGDFTDWNVEMDAACMHTRARLTRRTLLILSCVISPSAKPHRIEKITRETAVILSSKGGGMTAKSDTCTQNEDDTCTSSSTYYVTRLATQ